MADVNVHIPLPVLTGTQVFRVRYREVGTLPWTQVVPDQTNAPFTITGLTAGLTYELETTLIDGDIECPSVVQTFFVPDDIPCIDATAEIEVVEGGGREKELYRLIITYTLPSPFIAACSYEIIYGIVGSTPTVLTFTTLPPSPLQIIASNDTYHVTIRAFDCEGNSVDCFDEEVSPTIPPCVPGSLVSAEMIVLPTNPQTFGIRIIVNQSTPATGTYLVNYQQLGPVLSGSPDPGGIINFTGTPTTTTIIFPVNPNFNVPFINGNKTLVYVGNVIDECDFSMKWQANIELS